MELPGDVIAFVDVSFPPSLRSEALSLLAGATLHDGTAPGARLLRCAVVGSRGDLAELTRLVDLLAIECRDVILCGEYELRGTEAVRVRDLSGPLRGAA